MNFRYGNVQEWWTDTCNEGHDAEVMAALHRRRWQLLGLLSLVVCAGRAQYEVELMDLENVFRALAASVGRP